MRIDRDAWKLAIARAIHKKSYEGLDDGFTWEAARSYPKEATGYQGTEDCLEYADAALATIEPLLAALEYYADPKLYEPINPDRAWNESPQNSFSLNAHKAQQAIAALNSAA